MHERQCQITLERQDSLVGSVGVEWRWRSGGSWNRGALRVKCAGANFGAYWQFCVAPLKLRNLTCAYRQAKCIIPRSNLSRITLPIQVNVNIKHMRVCLFEKTVLDCVSVKIRGCMKSDRWSKTVGSTKYAGASPKIDGPNPRQQKNTRARKQYAAPVSEYAAPYLKYAGASPSIDGPNPRQHQNTRARI
jgi:hypothetical protein